MPSSWSVLCLVDDPARVTRIQVHGLVCSWIEHVFPRELHDHGIKPFTVAGLRTVDGLVSFDVRLMLDPLAEVLHDGVSTTMAAGGELGRQRARVVPHADGRLIAPERLAEWEDLVAGPVRSWEIDLRTLTTFRDGRRYDPDPTPNRVLGHLRSRWSAFAPDDLRYLTATPLDALGLTETSRELERAVDRAYHHGIAGVTGRVSQAAASADEADATAIGGWLGLTHFAGIGYGTSRGYGECRVTLAAGV